MDWEAKLPPKKRPPAEIPKQFMVRPPRDVAEWLVKQAERLDRSLNEVLVAIVEAEMHRQIFRSASERKP